VVGGTVTVVVNVCLFSIETFRWERVRANSVEVYHWAIESLAKAKEQTNERNAPIKAVGSRIWEVRKVVGVHGWRGYRCKSASSHKSGRAERMDLELKVVRTFPVIREGPESCGLKSIVRADAEGGRRPRGSHCAIRKWRVRDENIKLGLQGQRWRGGRLSFSS
jgi:hypothetical protein